MSQAIKDLASQMPTSYLRSFFAEKDIPEKTFSVEGPVWGENQIPNAVVVEHIARCSVKEATEIGEVLRRIDFWNGDINHFLQHLAKSLAK